MSALKKMLVALILFSFFIPNFQIVLQSNPEKGKNKFSAKAEDTTPPASTNNPWQDIKIYPTDETFASDKSFLMMLEAPDEAYVGDVIQVSTLFHIPDTVKDEIGEMVSNSQTNIDMIRLSIKDPTRDNLEHLKDAFLNLNNRKSASFTYSWDTLASSTRASSESHTITAYAYQKYHDGYMQTGQVTHQIRMRSMRSVDILKDGFWGAYLDENSETKLSDYWAKKLGCGSEDCIISDDIEGKMIDAINTGDFEGRWDGDNFVYNENEKLNQKDLDELIGVANAYLANVRVNPPNPTANDGDTFAVVFAHTTLVSQMLGTISEAMSGESELVTPDMIKNPIFADINEVISKYTTKIASYDPQSEEDFKNMDVATQIESDLKTMLERDMEGENGADDIITDEMLQEYYAKNNIKSPLKPEEARAIAPLIIGAIYLGGLAWSAYDAYREPNAMNIGMLAVSAIPGGGVLSKAGKVFKGGKAAITGLKGLRTAVRMKGGLRATLAVGMAGLKGTKAWLGTAKGVSTFSKTMSAAYAIGGTRAAAGVLGRYGLKGIGLVARGASKLGWAKLGLLASLAVIAYKTNKALEGICTEGWKTLIPTKLLRAIFCALAVLLKDIADSFMCFAKNQLISSLGYNSVSALPARCNTPPSSREQDFMM